MAGDWRNNVLFQTIDTNLNGGLEWNAAVINAGAQYPGDPNGTPTWYGTGGQPAGAMQIITDPGVDGLFGRTYTLIPTAAIAVPDATAEGGYVQYATVMSVRTWDTASRWTTNYSAIAYSTDGGETWTVSGRAGCAPVRRMFPETNTSSRTPWCTAIATTPTVGRHQRAIRTGSATSTCTAPRRAGRAPRTWRGCRKASCANSTSTSIGPARIPTATGNWATGDPSAAVPVIGSSENDLVHLAYRVADFFTFGLFSKILNGIWVGGLPTFGNVSEMSVQYNEYAGRYLVTYTDGRKRSGAARVRYPAGQLVGFDHAEPGRQAGTHR